MTPLDRAGDPLQLSLFDPFEPALPVAAAPAAPRPADRPHEPALPGAADAPLAHPRANRMVLLAGARVHYELRRARRRSIGMSVGLEGLAVSAPRWVGLGEIEQALRERAEWIVRKLREQRERRARLEAARIAWGDGARVPFLGRHVRVVLDPEIVGAVLHEASADEPRLHVGLPRQALSHQVRDAVQSWLQRQARRVFEERCAQIAPRLGVRVKRLALSSAATRWGSANANGSIRLHWRLIHFGLPVIDYVTAHELAHLREMNHSPAFWDIVRSVAPQYEHARRQLDEDAMPAFD
ncbi:MAG: SprT family zinc-dependent metalloprotease [Burkholderiaceae bacterium]